MTIRKGTDWGAPGPLHPDAQVLHDDADAAAVLANLISSDSDNIEIGLVGGDMHRTLGAPRHTTADLYEGKGIRLPIDLGILEFDHAGHEIRHPFLAHVVATTDRRSRWWKGRTVIVMNAAFVGPLNLGPRAHPNDGRIDVTDGALPSGDRRRALQRAATGTHVPHPDLNETRIRERVYTSAKPFFIRADGVPVAEADRFSIRCIPDAAVIVV